MKLIHAADIHLGSKLGAKLPSEKSQQRRRELRDTFARLVDYAKENGIHAILLSGDVFDEDTPKTKDVDYFYGVVKAHPEIDFYYLRGNHDQNSIQEDYPNLKRFAEKWTSYDLGEDVVLTGIEFSNENASSLYSTLNLDPKKKNIVTLHGQIGSGVGLYEINLVKLRDKGIDYLALGHIHERSSGKIDRRGFYAYPGCLEGRGYDETGKKGFYLIDTDHLDASSIEFVPFARRTIEEFDFDVAECASDYEVVKRIKEGFSWDKEDLLRINLKGESDLSGQGLVEQVALGLSSLAYHVSIKDKTTPKIDAAIYENSPTLRGEFVREVMASDYSEEEKKRIILAGLRALNGEEVER